jgi:hypothetical protein
MRGKLLLRLFSMFVAVAFSAFAQIDAARFAAELRANYGPPLTRDSLTRDVVFTVPVGEMVVDYATSGHICKIRLPGMAPEEGHPGVKSTKAVDDFLLKLLPLSMRGKELRKMQGQQGLASVLWTEYENVTISEVSQGQGRTGVTVIFTNEKC